MNIETLQSRIGDALERELSQIYNELNTETGDISPLQMVEWDDITERAARLFSQLIEQNKH